MKVTIYDVASKAGVSIKTVSRVLNNEPNVRNSTRLRVNEAIEFLNYRPNMAAVGLASEASHLLGLVYDRPGQYITDIQHGAMKLCHEKGYHLVVELWRPRSKKFADEVKRTVSESRLDGIILPPPFCDNETVLSILDAEKMPYIRIAPNHEHKNASAVRFDDYQAAFDMTKHLVELGHERIGFIKGAEGHSATYARYSGFVDALESLGVKHYLRLVKQGDFTYRSAISCSEKLLTGKSLPTAIFASNDDMAAAVVANAHRHNINIPKQLTVVGFDDSNIASTIWPELTTVRQPVVDMSAAAAEMLIKIATGPKNGKRIKLPDRVLDFEIIIRESSAKNRMLK